MIKKRHLFIIALLVSNVVYSQKAADTAALIKEFTKVMSFTSQPYLHYVTTTKMNAEPVVEALDTLSMTGEFYKNNTEIYSNNEREEMYLQDSLMIEINNDRKTIWVRKVDVATKGKMNLLPVNTKEMLTRFEKNYIISKSRVDEEISILNFEERKPEYSTSATTTFISMEYSEKTYLPRLIKITVYMKQPADIEMIAALKEQGVDDSKLIQTIDGVKYLVRKQNINIAFTTIDNDKEKLLKMPSYKSRLEFDEKTQEYVGRGIYKDYEITKTF